MFDFMTTFFGPLHQRYCIYFLAISVLFFISFVIMFLTELRYIFLNYNKRNFRTLFSGIAILFNIFIIYLTNRMLYTMCIVTHMP